jgi:hypothetical protein
MTRTVGSILFGILCVASSAFSQDVGISVESPEADASAGVLLIAVPQDSQSAVIPLQPVTTRQPLPAVPSYYSRAYDMRAKIHKYASFSTLPLVAGEFAVGQSLFDSPSDWKRSTHVALGSAIGGLFAVNSVTGVWNLVESQKDPNRGKLPLIHSLLALSADAGFVATAAITPGSSHDDGAPGNAGNKGTHRTLAFTSMGLATASYVIMLIGHW